MSTKPTEISQSARLASELLGARLEPEPAPTKRKYTVTDKETRGQHLKPHQWKQGQSGNPKGRPVKNLSLVSLVKEHLESHPEDAKAVAIALISMAKGQDMRAIAELLDRVDGKVAETHRIEGELPVTIQFVPASQLLARNADSAERLSDGNLEALEGEYREIPEEEGE